MGQANTPDTATVVVGQFAGPHGVRGEFKVRSFTEDPLMVAAYGPVQTAGGQILTLKILREAKPGLFVCRAPEIESREACDAFSAALLTVARAHLPPPDDDDEFYLSDLAGLSVRTPDGDAAGRVKSVQNFGAGDLLELEGVPGRSGTVFIAFTKTDVPEVDVAAGFVVVVLPPVDDGATPA